MLARKCDRCGKLYEHYLGVSKFKQDRKANGIIFIDRDTDNRYWSRDTLDFCPRVYVRADEMAQRRGDTWLVIATPGTATAVESMFPPDMDTSSFAKATRQPSGESNV